MNKHPDPTVAEFRAWMTRTPREHDRCTCGSRFQAGEWRGAAPQAGHFRCYARFRDEDVPATPASVDRPHHEQPAH